MMEIGYTSAVDSEVVRNNDDCRSILCEGYLVYAPEYWDVVDEDGNPLSEEDCDYASWEEFEEYFFDYCDVVDDSNWRYPFVIAENNEYNRSLDDLGVMRDFGANNHKVVTMWEDVRSTGITAWALLIWTLVVVAVVSGVVALWFVLKQRRKMRVIIKRHDEE